MANHLGSRVLAGLAALLSPVLAGAIIYYLLKQTHADLAHFGNWVSFAGFFLWPVVIRAGIVHFDGMAVPIFIASPGIVLAMVAVWAIRRRDALTAEPR
jgi:hypothetical protein